MKKIVLFLLVITTVFVTSCDKEEFLDQPLFGRQTLDDFFANDDNSELVINGIYRKVNGEAWWQINMQRQINEMATDDNWAGNTFQLRADIAGIATYNVFPGSQYFNNFWEHFYIGITRANLSLDRISVADIDEDKKTQYIGEANFLRAFFYFELVRNFGGVPIVSSYEEILDPSINDKTRASVEEVYAFIEENLKTAVNNLPRKSEYPADDLGRATKGAAQSLLAKVYLYQERWAEAQVLAKAVMDSGEYALEADFADLYRIGNAHGVESIFAIEFVNGPTFPNIGGQLAITNGSPNDSGWGWGSPTSDLENAFLSEGDNIRLRSTIIKHGEPVFGDPAITEWEEDLTKNKSGRTNRKYYVPQGERPEPYQRGQIPGQYIHIRLADVILIHAEAAYFNNDPTSARNSLKLVRDRVELDTNMSLSGSALRDAIWKERRLELALEQHRLYDIKRQKINGVPRIALILGPNGSFVKYNTEVSTDPFETTNLWEPQNSGALFDIDTHMLWPVPPEEIQLSRGNVVQNPGY